MVCEQPPSPCPACRHLWAPLHLWGLCPFPGPWPCPWTCLCLGPGLGPCSGLFGGLSPASFAFLGWKLTSSSTQPAHAGAGLQLNGPLSWAPRLLAEPDAANMSKVCLGSFFGLALARALAGALGLGTLMSTCSLRSPILSVPTDEFSLGLGGPPCRKLMASSGTCGAVALAWTVASCFPSEDLGCGCSVLGDEAFVKKSWLEAHKACLGGGGTAKGHAELRVPEPVALAGTVTSCFPNGELLVWASVLGNEAFAKLSLLPKQFLLQSLVASFRISTPPHGTMSYLSGSLVCRDVPAAAYWARSAQNLEKVRENLLNF